MKMIKKLIFLNSLLLLLLLFASKVVLARTAFEMDVDPDADGICGSAVSDDPYYLGPYYFCSPFNGEPDNCPEVANPDQADSDGDGVGDACDTPEDSDHDGIADCSGGEPLDLCPPPPANFTCKDDSVNPVNDTHTPPANLPPFPCNTSLLSQTQDQDGDGVGDACDPDVDGDGVDNEEDCNCLDPNVLGPENGNTCPTNAGGNPNPNVNPNDAFTTSGGCSLVTQGNKETAVPWVTMFSLGVALLFGRSLRKHLQTK